MNWQSPNFWITILFFGFAAMSWIIQRLREQAQVRAARERARRAQDEELRTGRPVSDQSPAQQQQQAIAQARAEQMRRYREMQAAAARGGVAAPRPQTQSQPTAGGPSPAAAPAGAPATMQRQLDPRIEELRRRAIERQRAQMGTRQTATAGPASTSTGKQAPAKSSAPGRGRQQPAPGRNVPPGRPGPTPRQAPAVATSTPIRREPPRPAAAQPTAEASPFLDITQYGVTDMAVADSLPRSEGAGAPRRGLGMSLSWSTTPSQLRRAVIESEILNPPLSLR